MGVQCCGLARWRARERERARARVVRVWAAGVRGRCRRVLASTCAGSWLAPGWHMRVARAWLACG